MAFFKKIFLFNFRERRREGEKKREKQDHLPDQEPNQWPLTLPDIPNQLSPTRQGSK